MSDQISFLLTVTCIVIGLFLLWAISIGITYWDASRRNLPTGEIIAWMILVTIIPYIGFAAYLFSRLLAATLSPREPQPDPMKKRVTMLKPLPGFEPRSGTIPAADLIKFTVPEKTPQKDTNELEKSTSLRYQISVIEGPHTGRKYSLKRLPTTIGRGSEASVSLDEDLGVSRQHAEIYDQAGVLRIRDLKSTHGTQVNGFSIDDKSLDPGDKIHIGETTLKIELREGDH